MATNWDDSLVQCPFYKSNRNLAIVCESIMQNSSTLTFQFNDKKSKQDYMDKYCKSDYKKCDICILCDKKYK